MTQITYSKVLAQHRGYFIAIVIFGLLYQSHAVGATKQIDCKPIISAIKQYTKYPVKEKADKIISLLPFNNKVDCVTMQHDVYIDFENTYAKLLKLLEEKVSASDFQSINLISSLYWISDGEFSEGLADVLAILLLKDSKLFLQLISDNPNLNNLLSSALSPSYKSNDQKDQCQQLKKKFDLLIRVKNPELVIIKDKVISELWSIYIAYKCDQCG